jgi:Zn-dependent protease with chaperone function/type II secretory pathway pseudopilin PulG
MSSNVSQLISQLLAAGKTDEEVLAELARKGLSPTTASRFLERAKAGGSPVAAVVAQPAPAPVPSAISGGGGGGFDPALLHRTEKPLFLIGAVFSAMVWLALIVSLVGILYGVIGFVFALVTHALFLANVKGNGVRVSDQQFPELQARCRRAAAELGVPQCPEVYLIQAGGVLNAFATKFLSRKFMVIYSGLADACEDPRQLDFVIGHEMGHIAAGHLFWNALLWPFMLVPWLGTAYLRAREYTADRCGHAFVRDLEPSMRGLVVLAAGGKYAARADLQAFMDQRHETGRFWSAVLELVSTHPYLCKRVAALQELQHPGTVAPVGRNLLAYPLAPFFGLAASGASGGGAGLLVMVAMVGIIAAIAIPSLLRARVAANEAAAIGDIRAVISQETAYAASNHGYFESDVACLATPSKCNPADRSPGLAGAQELASGTKGGYVRAMFYGHKFAAGRNPPGVSPSSTDGFAIIARPLTANQTGIRSFCGDASGAVCSSTTSSPNGLVERLDQEPWIHCSSACVPLN